MSLVALNRLSFSRTPLCRLALLAALALAAAPGTAQAAKPYHACKKALSYEISLRTNLQCPYAKLLVQDVAQQVASRWPVKIFYIWDHGTDTAGRPAQFRYTCHASHGSHPGPSGDITEVQSFRCSKVNGEGFNLVTEID
jgi:hypothetical protein